MHHDVTEIFEEGYSNYFSKTSYSLLYLPKFCIPQIKINTNSQNLKFSFQNFPSVWQLLAIITLDSRYSMAVSKH